MIWIAALFVSGLKLAGFVSWSWGSIWGVALAAASFCWGILRVTHWLEER